MSKHITEALERAVSALAKEARTMRDCATSSSGNINAEDDRECRNLERIVDQAEAAIAALAQQGEGREAVGERVIAGALFDLMGYLTCRDKQLVLSSTDDASPAVEALSEWAAKRGVSLDEALVREWQGYTHPQPTATAAVCYFAYDGDNGNYEEFDTLPQAIADAQKSLDYAGDDGWPDGGPSIVYGAVLGKAREVEGSRRERGPDDPSDFDFIVEYELSALAGKQPDPAFPEGMVLVPRRPTEAMIDAMEGTPFVIDGRMEGSTFIRKEFHDQRYIEDSWAAMLAAAQQPTATEQPAPVVPEDALRDLIEGWRVPESPPLNEDQLRQAVRNGARMDCSDEVYDLLATAQQPQEREDWRGLREAALAKQPDSVVDDRFPNGLPDAIVYANATEEAAADLHAQVLGHETDGSGTAVDLLREVAEHLKREPAPEGPEGMVPTSSVQPLVNAAKAIDKQAWGNGHSTITASQVKRLGFAREGVESAMLAASEKGGGK